MSEVEIDILVKVDPIDVIEKAIDSKKSFVEGYKLGLEMVKHIEGEIMADAEFTFECFKYFLQEMINYIEEEEPELVNPKFAMLQAMEPLLKEDLWREE